MNRKLAAVMLLAFCISASAQAVTQRKTRTSRPRKNGEVTLTGCLQAGFDRNLFTLDRIRTGGSQSGIAPGLLPRSDTSYVLIPDAKVNLVEHTGHEVELTGVPVPDDNASEPGRQPRFKVRTVRHIANSCQ